MGHQPRASLVQAVMLRTAEFPRKAVGTCFSAQEAVSLQIHRGTQKRGSETELGRVIAQFLTPQAPQKALFPF